MPEKRSYKEGYPSISLTVTGPTYIIKYNSSNLFILTQNLLKVLARNQMELGQVI
jgi:hypothetical protein